jgi:F-type H+-transporting ATPase subunit delta
MQNPRLAGRYAKSLMDIAKDNNAVDAVYADATALNKIFAGSKELVALLKSPIISADKKQSIFKELIGGKVNAITEQFINLVTNKGREAILPEVIVSLLEQYKQQHNINTVKLTVAAPMDSALQQSITKRIQEIMPNKQIDLQVNVNEALIGGFVLESNNTLFDASIARDLRDIQKQFLQNIYIPNIR